MRALRLTATAILLAAVLPAVSPAAGATPTCQGERATIVGTNGDDRLTGTPRRDVIVGLGGDDTILAGGGKDLVCGSTGADVLDGGPGNDKLYGGADRKGDDVGGTFLVGDLLRGGPGDDVLVGGWDDRKAESRRMPDTYSWTDAGRGVTVDLSGGTGIARGHGQDRIRIDKRMGVIGSSHNDTIVGSAKADDLDGRDGNDKISGRGGTDEIFAERRGGSGNDTVFGGDGADLIGSYAGRDDLRGGPGDDFIEAYGAQPASARGDSGADQIAQAIPRAAGMGSFGGAGRDVVSLYGDALEGSSPRARFTVDLRDGTTTVTLGSNRRGTIGSYEEYRLIGGVRWGFNGSPEADRVWAITGGELQAWTYGGDDWVNASDRDDMVNAGEGTDTVIGGKGKDVCRYAENGTC